MSISENIQKIKKQLSKNITVIPVSKRQPYELIQEAYDGGQRIFGENKVQELREKHEKFPLDIEWHMIGHLQTNKVKYIAPFINLIHSVDSLKLLKEINKRAKQNERIINCLLQIYIAKEKSKFGLSFEEIENLLSSDDFNNLENIKIIGLMGMATNTPEKEKIKIEFDKLKNAFEKIKSSFFKNDKNFKELSMGMSGDYKIAIESGSTMVRVGSLIFGKRNPH